MIKGKFCKLDKYTDLPMDIQMGLRWLSKNNLKEIELGKHIIDGKNLFVNIQEYQTKTDAKYEAHKKYVDIQCVIKGEEVVGVTEKENCTTIIPYDEEKDIEFMDINTKEKYQTLSEGEFIILYPEDAHKPSMAIDGKPEFVKKAVVKVRID